MLCSVVFISFIWVDVNIYDLVVCGHGLYEAFQFDSGLHHMAGG